MRKRLAGIGIVLLTATTIAGATGCGHYYKTQKQTSYAPQVIQGARQILVVPISFTRVAQPADYKSPADWQKEIVSWQKMWAEEIGIRAKKAGLAGRVRMLTPGEAVPATGIIVYTTVIGIRRNWSAFGGYDYLTTDIRFINAADKKLLFHGVVESTTKAFGPGGYRNYAFAGRVGTASWNMVPTIMSVIQKGRIEPIID